MMDRARGGPERSAFDRARSAGVRSWRREWTSRDQAGPDGRPHFYLFAV